MRTFHTRGLPDGSHSETVFEWTIGKPSGLQLVRVRIPRSPHGREPFGPARPEQAAWIESLGLKLDHDCVWIVREPEALLAALEPLACPAPPPPPTTAVRVGPDLYRSVDELLAILDREIAGQYCADASFGPDGMPGAWIERVRKGAPDWAFALNAGIKARWEAGDAEVRWVLQPWVNSIWT